MKTAKTELETRRKRWAEHERARQEMQARIDAGTVTTCEAEEFIVRYLMGWYDTHQMPDLVLEPPLPPAKAFLIKRLKRVMPPEEADAVVKEVMVDLLLSNISLDGEPDVRKWIADVLKGRTPKEQRDRAMLWALTQARAFFEKRGETLTPNKDNGGADEELAKRYGWKSGSSMLRWLSLKKKQFGI